MPLSMVRPSAGRESVFEAIHALCFMTGANSIFTGDSANPTLPENQCAWLKFRDTECVIEGVQ